ncbi:MAG: preprotein translocase subunit SecY [Candidatus Diapherotrites archaeon]|nr:preprotein translocase subunit SecY [Candidatus Diapherotrites archaeon]
MTSFFERFEPILRFLPEVRNPEVQPPLQKKIFWTGLALILFFTMGQISLIGIESVFGQQPEAFQLILASEIGTLITVGIGPIVLASIILQLLVGGGLIKADLTDPKEKARFTGTQKLLAILLSFFEGAAYLGFGLPGVGFIQAVPGMFLWVVLQIAIGSIILLYLDEVVSKHGIGSGIGLFIAAGVSGQFFWLVFRPPSELDAGGRIFIALSTLLGGQFIQTLIALSPIIFALVIFFVVVFAEGIHVNIPITIGRRGFGGRFPVKFLYVSNMPVILAVALFANIHLWATLAAQVPVLGQALTGLSWAVTSPTFGGSLSLVENLLLRGITPSIGGELVQAFAYVLVLIAACIVFGKFWVELGGQGSEKVAEQLQRAGMQIPGFRRDPRIMQKVLDRYIPPITILGSAFVGVLAAFSDLTTASLVSGTGILLTVGIVYRLYEELAKAQLMEAHPLLKRLLG